MFKYIKIQALFASGCGSRDATLLMIDRITRYKSLQIEFEEVTISSVQEAQSMKFLGSPSIRVNGRDIEPESIRKSDYGFG